MPAKRVDLQCGFLSFLYRIGPHHHFFFLRRPLVPGLSRCAASGGDASPRGGTGSTRNVCTAIVLPSEPSSNTCLMRDTSVHRVCRSQGLIPLTSKRWLSQAAIVGRVRLTKITRLTRHRVEAVMSCSPALTRVGIGPKGVRLDQPPQHPPECCTVQPAGSPPM